MRYIYHIYYIHTHTHICLKLKIYILIYVFGHVNLSFPDLGITVFLEIEIIQKRAMYKMIPFGCVSVQIRKCKKVKCNRIYSLNVQRDKGIFLL